MKELAQSLVTAVETDGMPLQMLSDEDLAYRRYLAWYNHVHDHYDEFRLLLRENGTVAFRQLLVNQGLDWYAQLLKPIISDVEDDVSLDVLVHYIIGAHMGLFEYYFNSGMRHSTEFMARQMASITMAGPYSILRDRPLNGAPAKQA